MRALPSACLLVLRCARPPTHDCCNTTTQLISSRGHDIGSLDKPGAEDIAAPWHTPLPLLPLPSVPLTCRPLVPSCWLLPRRTPRCLFGFWHFCPGNRGNLMSEWHARVLQPHASHSTTETSDTTDTLSAGTQSVASTSATVLPAARQAMPPLQPHGMHRRDERAC